MNAGADGKVTNMGFSDPVGALCRCTRRSMYVLLLLRERNGGSVVANWRGMISISNIPDSDSRLSRT